MSSKASRSFSIVVADSSSSMGKPWNSVLYFCTFSLVSRSLVSDEKLAVIPCRFAFSKIFMVNCTPGPTSCASIPSIAFSMASQKFFSCVVVPTGRSSAIRVKSRICLIQSFAMACSLFSSMLSATTWSGMCIAAACQLPFDSSSCACTASCICNLGASTSMFCCRFCRLTSRSASFLLAPDTPVRVSPSGRSFSLAGSALRAAASKIGVSAPRTSACKLSYGDAAAPVSNRAVDPGSGRLTTETCLLMGNSGEIGTGRFRNATQAVVHALYATSELRTYVSCPWPPSPFTWPLRRGGGACRRT